MLVLMRSLRLNEHLSLRDGRFPPLTPHIGCFQHPIHTAGAHHDHTGIKDHIPETLVSVLRVVRIVRQDRLVLRRRQPACSRDRRIVLVLLPVPLIPVVEPVGTDLQLRDQGFDADADAGFLFPCVLLPLPRHVDSYSLYYNAILFGGKTLCASEAIRWGLPTPPRTCIQHHAVGVSSSSIFHMLARIVLYSHLACGPVLGVTILSA